MINNTISFPNKKITKTVKFYMNDKNYIQISAIDIELVESWLNDNSIQFITIEDQDHKKRIINKDSISYIKEL